jgi:SnoaL-like protein
MADEEFISQARELLRANLQVSSERDPDERWAAIERTYAEDVEFVDPDGEFKGRQALNNQAQKILDGAPADAVLEDDGPRYVDTDTAVQAWRFGPPGSPVARGVDIVKIRDGRVIAVRTLLVPETDSSDAV